MAGLRFVDDEGTEVLLDPGEAGMLLRLTDGLDPVTVSACPGCRSRVVAAVALVDLLDAAPPHPRAAELVELAEAAPTLHLYVVDDAGDCRHGGWLDPGYAEWTDVVEQPRPRLHP
jgi:hypothetical protein